MQEANKKKLVFIGAGAIGRGFLPWLFDEKVYDFVFVDNDQSIIDAMRNSKAYSTFRIKNNVYEERVISVHSAFTPEENSFSLFEFQWKSENPEIPLDAPNYAR